ncbi:hypothetical protein [Dactylosporangium sp. NPDC006015]|uniref:hypothetical protein n=1 Tax=Dactylosporangium sp. NPDC006015 TaxID=3154576 RepID=UPI0033B0AD5E
MARNAPGAGRVTPRTPTIDGLSSRANAAIQALRPRIGDVGGALRTYRREIRQAGRWIDLAGQCPSPSCDISFQRDILEAALHALPRDAARELRRLVAALDEEFLRKTLPDPWAAARGPRHARAWWRQRLEDR